MQRIEAAYAMRTRPSGISGGVERLDPARVMPFAEQPRKRFRGIAKLAESIRLVGQITPIVVTRCDDPRYDAELVDGERRLRACLLGGMKVRAIFDEDAFQGRYARSIAANFCRQEHDAVEIMEAVTALLGQGLPGAEVAAMFGKTASWVSQYASLRKLHPQVLDQLKVAGDEQRQTKKELRAKGRMTLSLALLLVPFPQERQRSLLTAIRSRKMSLAQARTFVSRDAAEQGVKVGKRLSERKRLGAILSAVENCSHVAERYLRLPGSEIGPLIRSADRMERKEISEKLERLCESLLMLSDALSQRW